MARRKFLKPQKFEVITPASRKRLAKVKPTGDPDAPKKSKPGMPKKRGLREPKKLGLVTVTSGRGRSVGDSQSGHRSHRAFKKSAKAALPADPRPSYLPTEPIRIQSKLMDD